MLKRFCQQSAFVAGYTFGRSGTTTDAAATILAQGEVEVRDPILLCPDCKLRGARLRKKSGIRCITKHCAAYETALAEDKDINLLRMHLKREEEAELLDWAMSCQI